MSRDESPTSRPRVLIEDWLPVTELGIESRRERAAVHALPPLSFLHVWWARRPLVASAAVALGGLLPTWSENLAQAFQESPELASSDAYRSWVLQLVGIWGDPVAGQAAVDSANAAGIKLKGNPYGYRQAYRNGPGASDIQLLSRVLIWHWGESPLLVDPTAGGGAIPFVSARLGVTTVANDLNPIAASILLGGVEIPSRQGISLTPHLAKWGQKLIDRVEVALRDYFPRQPGETVVAYIWTQAIPCPRTNRLVPLLPNMWLRKTPGKEVAVRLVLKDPEGSWLDTPQFEIDTGKDVDAIEAGRGTVKRGVGTSPYDDLTIEGDYIKAASQNGEGRELLYAVAIKKSNGERAFRRPLEGDHAALENARIALATIRNGADASLLPDDEIPAGLKTAEPIRYGMTRWSDLFSDRQLLTHATFAREYLGIAKEIREEIPEEADDILLLLGLLQGKAIDYNSRLGGWDVTQQSASHVFDRHDLSIKWTFSEFDGAHSLYQWSLAQLLKTYQGIGELFDASDQLDGSSVVPRSVRVSCGPAAELASVSDNSVAHVCMDPPYYDNVMYAELSDLFYVWERRTLSQVRPDFFSGPLTDKANEAVANESRFAAMGRRKKDLATLDYEAKMTAIFLESYRVLRDDGVLTVMFTHKRAEAWDTLGMSLLSAGFAIHASWPVNTEAHHSLHQANKNSAASTIMLVCRKRSQGSSARVYLEDLESGIRDIARVSAQDFERAGIRGVDLLLSTYGPVLSLISEHWPVYSSTADEQGKSVLLRPEEALNLARQEVLRLQRARIVGREVEIDNHSDFVLMAWETFKAADFPFDDARRLALAVGGLDVDDLTRAKVLEKRSGSVRVLSPQDRRRRGGDDSSTGVRIDATRFDFMNDALDTVLYIAAEDGMGEAKAFMDRLGLTSDQRFLAYVQGMVNAMPRTRVKGEWVVPEAGLLDTLVTAHLPDVTLPAAVDVESSVVTAPTLFDEE
jgi:putative DNA methylase